MRDLLQVYAPDAFSKPLLSVPQGPQDLPALDLEPFENWLIELRRRAREAVVKRTQLAVLR